MKHLLVRSVALLALAVAGPAIAADMPVKAPVYKAPVVALWSWTGCYVGGNVGGLWGRKDWNDAVTGTFDGRVDTSGWMAGVQAGCNYQAGAWVFGIQGDYDWAHSTGSAVADPASTFTAGTVLQSRIRSLASVTGRVGYTWDRFLGYVKGGGAWVRDNYEDNGQGIITAASETRSGWTVGIGGEYAFAPNWSAFVEYDHYNFGTRTVPFYTLAGVFDYNEDIRQRIHVVKAGINFRFGDFGKGPVVARY